jgi:hypothetical protein
MKARRSEKAVSKLGAPVRSRSLMPWTALAELGIQLRRRNELAKALLLLYLTIA